MRNTLLALAALAASALALTATASGGRAADAAAASCAKEDLNLVREGVLSIGTDNPAYPPWFGGGETKGRPWKLNDPATGKGFESAVAYAIAKQLGFSKDEVEWVYTPFNKAIAPGTKAFDFAINQISYTPERAKVLTFSDSYYNVNQSIVALKGTRIASVRSVKGLRDYTLGAQLGTTSYQYIVRHIKPTREVKVYDTNDAAIAALKNRQIDGLVVDLPTAFYVTAVQVPNGKIVGQFPPPRGGQERFGMVFQKRNPLVTCVNRALARLRKSGQLQKLERLWLAKVTGAPILR
jgi:polar amino acid transport system substrate-binding protein